jgi:fucose 4-O-acetylase-like acetyltransferase
MDSAPVLLDSTKKRIEFIDLLKAFVIFCVLWNHSLGDLRTGYFFLADPVLKFLATFHMPLFFMISGFFFSSLLKLSFKDIFQKRFNELMVPHITWSLLITLMTWGMSFMGWRTPFADKPFTIQSRIEALFIPDPGSELWFFRDLFLVTMIVFIACKIFKKPYIAFVASMLFVLPFNYFGLVDKMQRFLMPVFWIGILLKAYYPIFSKHLNKFLIGSGIVFILCVYFYDYTYIVHITGFPPLINFQQSLSERKIMFDFTNIGISVFRSFTGIMGSIFFFALFQRCWKKNSVTSFLSRCGQLTVGIYGIQAILLQRLMLNLLDFKNIDIWIFQFIITPITSAFVFFVSILIIRWIQQNKQLTFVLFGSSLLKREIHPAENPINQKSNSDGSYQSD